MPTDTVYGLAARPTDSEAVRAVYRAKGRPEGMHLPVLAADVDQVRALGVAYGPTARSWPGAGGRTPDHGVRLRARVRPAGVARLGETRWPCASRIIRFSAPLLAKTGVLVVTSANPHGVPTPRTAQDVAAGGLGSSVDVIIDGGP